MKKITKKQKEVLLLFAPKPIGEGLKEKEIAKRLGIALITVKKRLFRFKSQNPDAYEKLWDLKKKSTQIKNNLKSLLLLERIGGCDNIAVNESITSDGKGEKILEKF